MFPGGTKESRAHGPGSPPDPRSKSRIQGRRSKIQDPRPRSMEGRAQKGWTRHGGRVRGKAEYDGVGWNTR